MRVRVELLPDRDPRIYDADTEEEVTLRCREIVICPCREATATLLLLRDGKPYVSHRAGRHDLATEEAEVVAISGTWASGTLAAHVKPREATA